MTAKFTSPHSVSRTARLYSPQINNQISSCVNFWYKTSGPIEFNVKKLNSNGVFDPTALFTARGDRGNEWSLGRGTLTSAGTKVQIVFEAVDLANSARDGEVWLDDIEINYSQACPQLGSCTFENDICGFSYSSAGDFDWVRLNGFFGSLQNVWSVPTFDHTLNTTSGSFLYLDTNGKDNGKKAIIESEIISETAGVQCLQFYLKTNSFNKATLKVTRKNKITGDLYDVSSINEANNGDFWVLKEVELASPGFAYNLLFQGIVGQNIVNQKGQLAIDDIDLLNRPCGSVIGSSSSTLSSSTSATKLTTQASKPVTFSTTSTIEPITNKPDSCPLNYCSNGGTCISLSNGYKCNCPNNYTGFRCEESLKDKDKGSNSNIFKLDFFYNLHHF
jgi:hypothetical protein